MIQIDKQLHRIRKKPIFVFIFISYKETRKTYIQANSASFMYKVGKYEYSSKESYQNILVGVFLIFFISMFFLILLKNNMSAWLYQLTLTINLIMQIHLILRYLHSKARIDYIFNEY